MRASRTKKPGVAARARAKRPGAMRAHKAGGGADKRRPVKPAHPKPRTGTKPAEAAKPNGAPHKETAAAAKKVPPVVNPSNGVSTTHRPEPVSPAPASTAPRGTPPPLPAPIASFTF